MQYCSRHAKYLFNSALPNTRIESPLRRRSRKTTRLTPFRTRADGQNIPFTPEFRVARPNAWQRVSFPASLIFSNLSFNHETMSSHAGRSAVVRSIVDDNSHSIPQVTRGLMWLGERPKSSAS